MSFLNKKIINFETEAFGLDLSDLSVKVFQLEKEGDINSVRGHYSIDIAPGNIEDGKIINEEKIAAVIKEAMEKSKPKKINTKKVICSLPESKVFLRIIRMPKMTEEEISEAIKWEIEAGIPLSIEQVYFDWQVIAGKSKPDGQGTATNIEKQDILTVAVSREIVDALMRTLKKAGLEVYGLEVESIASARSLIGEQKNFSESSILIVDFGAQRTSFIIIENGVPCFTVSIPFSSEGINESIAKKMNLNREESEKIKVEKGIEDESNNGPIFSAVKPLLENLVSEIEKSIDFYSDLEKKSAPVKKIILCGGGSNLKGLVPFLTKRLNLEVEAGNPWINIKLGKHLPPLDKENSVRYSTVMGLALRGLNYED